MGENTLRFARALIFMAMGAIGVFCLQILMEVVTSDYPLSRLSTPSAGEARDFIVLLNTKLNQTMAVTFTAVGIAVPLTANMYSLKFLDFFVRNPINLMVLVFIVFVNLSGLWASYSLRDNSIPAFQINLLHCLTTASLLLILPFLIYLFRFLHPNTLLTLLEREGKGCLKASTRPEDIAKNRRRFSESLEHIANIAVRSVDRSDRHTAIGGVMTLERVARHYWGVKEHLPPAWFEADRDFFPGFSSSVVKEIASNRSWVETKLYHQFFEVLGFACPRMPELTNTLAKSLRKLGLEPTSRNDPILRELTTEYFNTFLRLTLNRRDVRSTFILFDQYRYFAEQMNETDPKQVLEIAYYFEYYSQTARDQQMPFVVEGVAHDLRTLVQGAWENGAPNRERLLERFLRFDQDRPFLPGVKKAQALLASFFLVGGHPEPVKSLRACFQGLSRKQIETVRDDLIRVTRQKYWEVSERRTNIEFVPDPQREKIKEFLDDLLASHPDPRL